MKILNQGWPTNGAEFYAEWVRQSALIGISWDRDTLEKLFDGTIAQIRIDAGLDAVRHQMKPKAAPLLKTSQGILNLDYLVRVMPILDVKPSTKADGIKDIPKCLTLIFAGVSTSDLSGGVATIKLYGDEAVIAERIVTGLAMADTTIASENAQGKRANPQPMKARKI